MEKVRFIGIRNELVAGEHYPKGWRRGADGRVAETTTLQRRGIHPHPFGAAVAASFCRRPHTHPTTTFSFHGEYLRSPRPRSTRRSYCTQSAPEAESLVIWAERKQTRTESQENSGKNFGSVLRSCDHEIAGSLFPITENPSTPIPRREMAPRPHQVVWNLEMRKKVAGTFAVRKDATYRKSGGRFFDSFPWSEVFRQPVTVATPPRGSEASSQAVAAYGKKTR